jgi:electron transport complex protein RnfD
MKHVVIALCPAAVMGIYYFGLRAALVIVLSIASCVFFEAGYQRFTKQELSVSDFSAVVTGLLLAMNLPASSPWWMPIVGGFFAIVIVKQLFGGLGQNFMNPALAARAFLLAAYPARMTAWTAPVLNPFGLDAVSAATPLAVLKETGAAPISADYINALIGNTGGAIGETCALALILGGAYLIVKGIISWRIPAAYLGTVFVATFIFGRNGLFQGYPFYELITGGLLLGAFFMATDYSTSPIAPLGQLIMGVGCGLLTSVIRVYSGGYPEGVSYSILCMNLAVPLIDRYARPRVYGVNKKGAAVK